MPAPFAARRMYPRKPEPIDPISFAEMIGAVDASIYDMTDYSNLFSDVAGTVPAAVDDVVRYVGDPISGRALTIPTAGAEPVLRAGAAGSWLEFDPTNDRIYSSADWTVQAPHFVVSVFSRAVEDSLHYSGASGGISDYHRIMGTTSGRVTGASRNLDSANATVSAVSNIGDMSVNEVRVVSTLLLPGYQDVLVNDFSIVQTTNVWTDATVKTGSRLGINTNGGSAITSSVNHAQNCYFFGAYRGGEMDGSRFSNFHRMRRGLHRALALKAGMVL